MSRKRHRLVPETFGLKRRREQVPIEAVPVRGESGSARAAVAELVQLFPRGLFEDALPPIALKSQLYSLLPDRTVADRQLVVPPLRNLTRLWLTSHHPGLYREMKELQEQGEVRIIQLGFDLDAHGIIFTEDYRTRVLRACDGRPYAGAVQKFLASVLPACGDLSFQQDQMTQTFGFKDPEITQLVNAGVLTVRDAGSWWLAVPGAGRFIKYFVKGILSAAQALCPSGAPFGGSSGPQALLPFPISHAASSRAPDCPCHGPEGQVPGTTPLGAPGPPGTCCSATWPHLPCARPHWGSAGRLCLHHFWNPPPPARDVRILLVAYLSRVREEPRSTAQWWLRQGHLGQAWEPGRVLGSCPCKR